MTKKMSILESEQLFKRKLSVVVSEINNLFNNSNNEIIEMLTNKNIKTRTNKLTFNDALLYKFKCAFENSYNKSIANEINFTKENINNIAHVSNYYRKEQQIPVEYYNNILIKIQELSKKYSSNSKLFLNLSNKELQEQQELLLKKLKLISVDGTYSNTNESNKKILETSLNMGYFDPINKVPIFLSFKGENNKNKEIESLINDISENNFDYTNSILILDRGYFSYDLMNLLENKNIKYVIRIRNNCIHLNKNKNKKRNNKIINEKPNNIRFINYIADVEKIKKNSKNKSVKINIKIECNIATNLDNNFSDTDIKNIYLLRWSVEEYFKFIKKNFRFSHLTEHNKKTKDCYEKLYIIIQIYSLLIDILENIYESHYKRIYNNKNNNYNNNYNRKIMVEGIPKIINNIINCNLTEDILYRYYKCFIDITYSIKNANNPRVSKIPFTKWYVKSYSDIPMYAKIIDALQNKDLSVLNKNLKLKANTITLME
jgi:predicted  nucleic acid-binding Zn-ribbon protein